MVIQSLTQALFDLLLLSLQFGLKFNYVTSALENTPSLIISSIYDQLYKYLISNQRLD